jgi:hypothetical protein
MTRKAEAYRTVAENPRGGAGFGEFDSMSYCQGNCEYF